MNTPQISPVYNLIILDESGSMHPLQAATITGFNEIVQTIQGTQRQFPDQPQFITLVTFNGLGVKTRLDKQPAEQLLMLDSTGYQPNASTPLHDALGRSLMRLELQLEPVTNPTVLVNIMTDGAENASQEFSGTAVKAIIQRLQSRGWSFTYMGANHAVEQVANALSIQSTIRFDHSQAGMNELFERDRKGRTAYYEKKRRGMSSSEAEQDYFQQS